MLFKKKTQKTHNFNRTAFDLHAPWIKFKFPAAQVERPFIMCVCLTSTKNTLCLIIFYADAHWHTSLLWLQAYSDFLLLSSSERKVVSFFFLHRNHHYNQNTGNVYVDQWCQYWQCVVCHKGCQTCGPGAISCLQILHIWPPLMLIII